MIYIDQLQNVKNPKLVWSFFSFLRKKYRFPNSVQCKLFKTSLTDCRFPRMDTRRAAAF